MINYLKDNRYPCSKIFKNKNGDYVGTLKNKPYALFEFIEGKHVKHPNEVQWKEFVRQAAALQILTKNYKSIYTEARWNYSPKLCGELAIKETRKLNTIDSQKKLVWLKKELSALNLPLSLSKGICHCDFDLSNVIFKGNRLSALIDFDDANFTYLTFDLVGLIERRSWLRNKDFNFLKARKVVREYSRYRPLSDCESKHLFDVYKLSILFDCIWFYKRGDSENFYEKKKIDYLNSIGRKKFYNKLFI